MSDWITHDGGPCPVATLAHDFEIRLRSGAEIPHPAGSMSNDKYWAHNQNRGDIIAYRIPPPPEPLARDMTTRERFAMAAMQGILSNPRMNHSESVVVSDSLTMADALLAALREKRDDA